MSYTSIIRKEEHRCFSNTEISGKVLDLGGGRNAPYLKDVQSGAVITSINIDAGVGCSVVHDLEKMPLPFDQEYFDVVVANNTLEHIFHARELVKDSARVLRHGGKIVLSVPFMFPYHSSPHDYWRYTPDALQLMLEEACFTNVTITKMGVGIFTSTSNQFERLMPRFLQRLLVIVRPIVTALDWVMNTSARVLHKSYNPTDYSIGYFVTAIKK